MRGRTERALPSGRSRLHVGQFFNDPLVNTLSDALTKKIIIIIIFFFSLSKWRKVYYRIKPTPGRSAASQRLSIKDFRRVHRLH